MSGNTAERIKVTMDLTQKDAERTEAIRKRLHTRSKASAVGAAIAVADMLTAAVENGSEILIKDKDGKIQKILITGM